MYKDVRRAVYSTITDADELKRLSQSLNDETEIVYLFNSITTLDKGDIQLDVIRRLPNLKRITGRAYLTVNSLDELRKWASNKRAKQLEEVRIFWQGIDEEVLDAFEVVMSENWKPGKKIVFNSNDDWVVSLTTKEVELDSLEGGGLPEDITEILAEYFDSEAVEKLSITPNYFSGDLMILIGIFTNLKTLVVNSETDPEFTGSIIQFLTLDPVPPVTRLEIPFHFLHQHIGLGNNPNRNIPLQELVLTSVVDIEATALERYLSEVKQKLFPNLSEITLQDVTSLDIYAQLHEETPFGVRFTVSSTDLPPAYINKIAALKK